MYVITPEGLNTKSMKTNRLGTDIQVQIKILVYQFCATLNHKKFSAHLIITFTKALKQQQLTKNMVKKKHAICNFFNFTGFVRIA